MRVEGKLSKWNEARGFGFITPVHGGGDVFVHISAFPRNGRPRLHEQLSFDIEQAQDGKTRAVNVQRPGSQIRSRSNYHSTRKRTGSGFKGMFQSAVWLLIIAAILYSALTGKYGGNQSVSSGMTASGPGVAYQDTADKNFQCDGRIHCSEMTSCAEAEFFLKNCPGTQMDGNHDGEPCESQWCGSGF